MNKSTKRWAIGAMIAGAAGYLAGILTAPKSGRETRDDIKHAAENGMQEAEKQLKKLHTQINQTIAEAKDAADTLKGTAKKDLDAAISKATAAKEKAREMLSALHEGDAQDKELQKAIKDAAKAVDHLKSYLAHK
jgi:gas vesicle protein